MALPVCLPIPDPPDPSEIVIPGGATLGAIASDLSKMPDLCSNPLSLLAQAGPALAPLKPFFDVLGAVIQVDKCVKAVPKAVSQLSPAPIFSCLPELAKKIDALLKLIPQLSVPYAILSIIDQIIALLSCLQQSLTQLAEQAQRIADRIDQAAEIDDPNLDAILQCAQDNIQTTAAGYAASLAGVGQLIGVLNILLGLIGGPEIPSLGNLADVPIEDAVEPIEAIVKTLQDVRNAIPLP